MQNPDRPHRRAASGSAPPPANFHPSTFSGFVFLLDEAGRVEWVNEAAARQLGFEVTGLLGRHIADLFTLPQGLGSLDLGAALTSDQALEFQSKANLPGGQLPVELTVLPVSHSGGWRGAAVTARPSRAPRPQEDVAVALFREAPIMMFLVGADLRVLDVNRSAARFAHCRPATIIGRAIGEAIRCVHALEHRACGRSLFCKECRLRSAVTAALSSAKTSRRTEVHLLLERPDWEGETTFLVSTIPVRGQAGRQVLLCVEDATERKRAEEALQESQRALATLMSNLPGMAYRCRNDEFWTMEFVSQGCKELTGYAPSELVHNAKVAYEELIHPEDRTVVRKKVEEAVARHRPFELVYRIKTADGEEKWVWEKGRGVFTREGDLVALEGFITDITARKKAEEEKERMQALLLHAQKMEAVGMLAGGIAHDFNNLLTIIQGNAELALLALGEGDGVKEALERVLTAAERGASLVRQLRLFGRKQPMEPRSLDLNEVLSNLLAMLGRLIGEDISIETDLAPDLWPVSGDETNLEQVVMNLAVNARDAMPSGGTLTIATDNVVLGEDDCVAMPEGRPGRFVQLMVSDTGHGMDEQTIARIFEPFFTTKGPGQGSGLGLSVVYGIVKEHDGWITVRSKPGAGTTFTIYLPASFPSADESARAQLEPGDLRGAGQRILVVEDEWGVRQFVTRALTRYGYRVAEASTAAEAVAVFARENGKFDLLITDVVLTDTSGTELAEKLVRENPQLRVLLTSGYADDRVHSQLIERRGFAFLQKPCSLVGLLLAVRDALASELSHKT